MYLLSLGRTVKSAIWYVQVVSGSKRCTETDCRSYCDWELSFLRLEFRWNGLFGLSTKQDAPVHNFVFKNSTFHANNLTKALITGLGSMTGELNVTIENCTFEGNVKASEVMWQRYKQSIHVPFQNVLKCWLCKFRWCICGRFSY